MKMTLPTIPTVKNMVITTAHMSPRNKMNCDTKVGTVSTTAPKACALAMVEEAANPAATI